MPDRDQRKLAAIFVADLVGYSRLTEADEAGTLRRLKAAREQVIDRAIDEFGGRIVHTWHADTRPCGGARPGAPPTALDPLAGVGGGEGAAGRVLRPLARRRLR